MKSKFLKYWRDIPTLYAFAFILDPRAKMREFHKVLLWLNSLTNTDYSIFPSVIRNKLTRMFQIYELKFGEVCLNINPQPSGGSGNATKACDDIYGDDDSYSINLYKCYV
jgi:hypothetical protein